MKKSSFQDGTKDWQRLSKKLKVHAQSQNHVSCFIYDQWKRKKGMIDEASMADVSEEEIPGKKFCTELLISL